MESVVIDDLYCVNPVRRPAEAEAPLVVDADGVLSGAGALERLKPVARGNPEIVQSLGQVQLDQFAPGRHLDGGRKIGSAFVMKNRLGGTAGEGLDHVFIVTHDVSNVKRNYFPDAFSLKRKPKPKVRTAQMYADVADMLIRWQPV